MIWFVLLVVAALVAAPFVIEANKPRMGREQRTGAPGSFAKLSQGVTYYRWHGPVRGPVIVAIHGLTTPSPVFDNLADGLGALGYRVLTYDLYGRGLSDAPGGPQSQAFFHQQLDDLLADQGVSEDITLMGYSMGGALAATYAAAHVDRMKRVILLAPAGITLIEDGFTRFCRTTPYVGDWLHLAVGPHLMARTIRADLVRDGENEVAALQLAELERRGYMPAVLASRRDLLVDVVKPAHVALGRADVPVIAIWGKEDTVIPLSALGTLSQWNRRALQEVIDTAGHGLTYSHSEAVVTRLRNVLREGV